MEPYAFQSSTVRKLGLDPNVYFNKQGTKPVAILTNTLAQNFLNTGNLMFRDHKFQKMFLTKPQTLARFRDYDPTTMASLKDHTASIEAIEGLTLRKAITHLQTEHFPSEKSLILVEAGAATTLPAYGEDFD